MNPEEEAEEDGANVDLDSQRKGKCVVLKTSTRQVSWSPNSFLHFFCLLYAACFYSIFSGVWWICLLNVLIIDQLNLLKVKLWHTLIIIWLHKLPLLLFLIFTIVHFVLADSSFWILLVT